MIIFLTRSPSFPSNIELKNACKNHDKDHTFLNPFEETIHHFPLNSGDTIIPRCSGVLFDDLDLHLCEQWESQGYQVINHSQSLRLLRDKDRQFLFCEKEKLPIHPFALLRGDPSHAVDYLQSRLGDCPHGYLIKSIRSNQGKGQFKAESLNELQLRWRDFQRKQDQRYLVTPYMEDFREFRILFIDNQYYGVEKSKAHYGHQRNADNSNFSPFTIPSEIQSLTQKVKRTFKLFYGAIDLVFWRDQYYILEINGLPGLSGMSQALETNLAEKFILALEA